MLKTGLNRKIALAFVLSLFFVSAAYADYNEMDLESDLLVGKWICVKAPAGSLTPIKYLDFYKDLSLDAEVGNCLGIDGEYMLYAVDQIEIGKFADVKVSKDTPDDAETFKLAKEMLLDLKGVYTYKFSPSGNELTLIDKRGIKYEFVREEEQP
ncbi:MAG: hypothetical protein PHN57_04645 [Candidatus Omnitrophica bacterium]|nr:hypothetical protein [Candidatus Omnitrophota bacterium]